MIVSQHTNKGRLLLGVVDESLIGKKIVEGKKQLDLSSNFYKGKIMDEAALKELCKKSYAITFIGINSVNFALREKLATGDNILKVSGVPHLNVVFLDKS